MKKTLLCFVIIFSLVLPAFGSFAAAAETERKVVRVAISNDENIIIERILYTALERLGYDPVISMLGMKTAVISADNGENDVLAVQALEIGEMYHNLMPVPVPISHVNMAAYTKADFTQKLDSWDDLEGLRVVYHPRNLHVENHIPAGAVTQPINDFDLLYQTVLDGEADVLILPITELSSRVVPEGLVERGNLETVETYTFVNKDRPELAEELQEEYREMILDGTIKRIKDNKLSAALDDKVVLHISSYSSEMIWENKLVQGVRDALVNRKDITYYNLSLNLRRLTNVETQYELMVKSVEAAFIERNPDVIIVSDNNALEFIVQNYSMLFHNLPVIYCGINDYSPAMIYGLEDSFAGIEEDFSTAETVEEMLKLFPETEYIYILNDYSASGVLGRKDMEQKLSSRQSDVKLIYNSDIPLSQIVNQIQSLGDNTLILCGSYYKDGAGKYYSEQELSDILGRELQNPVFCQKSSDIGFGTIIGGKVSDAYGQGKEAARLALEVLNGKAVSELEIAGTGADINIWMFDHEAAHRYGISDSQLPAGHTAINKEKSLFESNPAEAALLVTILCCALLFAFVSIIFAVVLRRKNQSLIKIQKNLHTAEELLEKDDKLRRSQADLYTLLNSVMQPVMVIELDDGKVLYVNDAYVKKFAFLSREEAVGHGVDEISAEYQPNGERSADRIRQNNNKIRQQNGIEPFEWLCVTQTGEEFYGRVMVNGIRFNDRIAYTAVIQDITADKQQTEMLQKAAKLEHEANDLKSQFVVNISHELRTPMNAIIGLSQIALRKSFEEEAHQMFVKVNRSAKLLLELINDVLDFSKIEANKIELFTEEVELETVISDATMVIVPRIESKPVELVVKLEERLPKYILGDKTRIWQVLKNILDNSAKFTNQGEITLSAAVAAEQPQSQKTALEFCIKDTGAGMTPEQLENIYHPFEQFHQSRSTISGTGLGMSITKQLVELMGGTIQVLSIFGAGTETRIVIPVEIPEHTQTARDILRIADQPADGESQNHSYEDVSVLLVEDNEINQEVAASMLEFFGIYPVIAENGKEAIALLEQQHFDLIFMDLLMPVMDGHETTLHIRNSDRSYRDIPIVAMTANVVKEEIELCIKNGMNDHIGKPVEFEVLHEKLNKWLKKTE